jgi:EAL domain-containing protein (putative c-di-GMP-specific phosphodiesterase class I)
LNVFDDPVCRAVVASVVEIGRHLGVKVTAEGVELAEQADALRALGVRRAQGYLYGRPMPLDELLAFLHESGVVHVR